MSANNLNKPSASSRLVVPHSRITLGPPLIKLQLPSPCQYPESSARLLLIDSFQSWSGIRASLQLQPRPSTPSHQPASTRDETPTAVVVGRRNTNALTPMLSQKFRTSWTRPSSAVG